MILLALRFLLCSINTLTLVTWAVFLIFICGLVWIVSVPTLSVFHCPKNLSDTCEQHVWTLALLFPLGLYIRRASLIAPLVKNPLQCRRPWFDSGVGKIRWRRDRLPTQVFLGFPYGSAGKDSACGAEHLVWSLGREDPLEKGKAQLQYSGLENSMGSQGVRHDGVTLTYTGSWPFRMNISGWHIGVHTYLSSLCFLVAMVLFSFLILFIFLVLVLLSYLISFLFVCDLNVINFILFLTDGYP